MVSSALPFQILFEDEDLFIVNKPPSIHSVIVEDSHGRSVAEALLSWNQNLSEVSVKEEDGGLVNRLDFATSGILLGAKTREVWEKLRQSTDADGMKKSYLMLVDGIPKREEEVSTYLGSPSRSSPKVKVYTGKPRKRERALPARTHFECLQVHRELKIGLLRGTFSKGRRHQIRAHAAHIGNPLIGDAKYGAPRSLKEVFSSAGLATKDLPEFALHSEGLILNHPRTGNVISVQASLPEYFELLVKDLPGWGAI